MPYKQPHILYTYSNFFHTLHVQVLTSIYGADFIFDGIGLSRVGFNIFHIPFTVRIHHNKKENQGNFVAKLPIIIDASFANVYTFNIYFFHTAYFICEAFFVPGAVACETVKRGKLSPLLQIAFLPFFSQTVFHFQFDRTRSTGVRFSLFFRMCFEHICKTVRYPFGGGKVMAFALFFF